MSKSWCEKWLKNGWIVVNWVVWKQFYKTKSRQMSLTCFGIENVWPKIGKTNIWQSKKQNLLGVGSDRTLSFGEYIGSIYRKDAKKFTVLVRLSNPMCINSFDGKSFDRSMHWMTVWLLPFNLDVP